MKLKDKKILVTGGSGFLGQHVVGKLVNAGVPRENIFTPGAKELDLRERKNCDAAVKGQEVVFHLAGNTGNVELSRTRPAEVFYDNMVMSVELMDAARIAGVEKFITIGSALEYPDNAPLPFNEKDLWSGPFEPFHAPYTIAKKMLLVQSQAYRKQYGFNAIHLILTSMYGPNEHSDGGPIPALIERIKEAKKTGASFIEAWGTGNPTRDFLYVGDAVEGIVSAAEKYDKPEPINIASGREISIKELAQMIILIMDYKGEIRWDASKPDGQPRRMLDVGSAEREIGFKAATGLEEGLEKTIEWHLNNQ